MCILHSSGCFPGLFFISGPLKPLQAGDTVMKLTSLICILSLLLLACSGVADAKASHAFTKAPTLSTWLWDTSKIVSQTDVIIEDLAANGVNLLHLQINPAIEPGCYKDFIRKASQRGIRVHALDGAPEWVEAGGSALQQTFLTWLQGYQQSASDKERFGGIHLDVEPYESEGYEQNANRYIENYQTMMRSFQEWADRNQLELGIDIPFWFHGVKYDNKYGAGLLAEWLCKQVKFITIMAYRDKAAGDESILSVSAAQMKLFEKYQVRGSVAVETGKLAPDYSFVTFYAKKKEYMYEQLDQVYQRYKSNSAFEGIAIHHYDSWMKMT